jgi:TonB family protein
MNMNDPRGNRVLGLLPGVPSLVEFVKVANINDYAFSEPPANSNEWRNVEIRIRPKDPNRTIVFSVIWKKLQGALPEEGKGISQTTAERFDPPLAIKKVSPSYPASARAANISGIVFVSAEIDEDGKVETANAISGPIALRQAAEDAAKKWRFKPARRNGVPVRATQQLQFSFQP